MLNRTRIKEIFNRESSGGQVLVQGWVKTKRSSGAVSFLQISDGSTLKDLQIVVEPSLSGYEQVDNINTGCSVSVVGELVPSQGKGQKYEVQATNDLKKWNLVDTIEGTGLEIMFTDYREALFERQYYRVKVKN